MFNARPHQSPVHLDSQQLSPLPTRSASSRQNMSTATLTLGSNAPSLTAHEKPYPDVPPLPSSDHFPNAQRPMNRRSTSARTRVPQPPPPIDTRTSTDHRHPRQSSARVDREFQELWNGGSKSPRPRADTATSSEVDRSGFTNVLFRAKSAGSASRPSFDADEESLRRTRTDPLPPLTPDDILIPTSAREHAISDASSLPPTPRLRTSDSIPDHRKLRYVHPESAKSRQRPDPAFGGMPSPTPPSASPHLSSAPFPSRDRARPPVRESVKSTYTTASSRADVSSIERSSTTTSMTSASDHWNPQSTWGLRITQEEFSVEDYISLYAAGFEDDPPVEEKERATLKPHGSPWPASGWDHDAPPVPKIDFTNARLHVPPKPAPEPLPRPSALTTEIEIPEPEYQQEQFDNLFLEPGPDPNSDRYGFKKDTRYITLDQYEAWSVQYGSYLSRRRLKWDELMKQHRLSTDNPTEFPPRSDKVKRFIRKGFPPEWRGAAWFWYAGGPARLQQNRGLYAHLLDLIEQKGQLGEGDREHIERDLNRTFPDNDKFKRYSMTNALVQPQPNSAFPGGEAGAQLEMPERPMIHALRRVLQTFAVYQPKIGYCQSLNFLAGKLLLFLDGDEEKAFHLLCILTSEHLPGTHGVALEGANVDIGVFMTTLKDQMPALWAKLEDRSADQPASPRSPLGKDVGSPRLPTVSLATTSWFMSCFVGTLPVETCCRVWDVLFYEGSKTLFRVALGIFKLGEPEIRTISDPMEIFQIVQTLPRKMLDSNALMEASLGKGMEGRGLLSQDTVKRRREERREVYQRQRATTTMMRSPSTPNLAEPAPEAFGEVEEEKRPLSRGASFKRLTRFKSISRKKAPPVPNVPGE